MEGNREEVRERGGREREKQKGCIVPGTRGAVRFRTEHYSCSSWPVVRFLQDPRSTNCQSL